MLQEIKATQGKIFSVEFTKKNGENRKMLCRLGVKKHLKGGVSKNKNVDHVVVYDLRSKGYRTINTKTVTKMKFQGNIYLVRRK